MRESCHSWTGSCRCRRWWLEHVTAPVITKFLTSWLYSHKTHLLPFLSHDFSLLIILAHLTVANGNEVLPRSHKKSISRDPHTGRWGEVVRFIAIEIKHCPQGPGVSSLSILLWKKSSPVFIKSRRRARVQKFCAIHSAHARSLVQFSLCLSPAG